MPESIPRPRVNLSFTVRTSSPPSGSGCGIYRRKILLEKSRRVKRAALALAFAADELLDAAIRFVVGHLNRGMFGEIRRGRMQHAANAAIKRKLATADCIDRHAGGVWRIFDGKFHIDFHGHIAEEPAFHSDKSNLVIELPGYVIARADVNIFV